MFKNTLFNKLLFTYIILIIVSLGFLTVVAIEIFSRAYQDEVRQHLENTAYTVRTALKDYPDDVDRMNKRVSELGAVILTRITVIDKGGVVLADSERDHTTMENHNGRPEVVNARARGLGENIRRSQTLSLEMFYVAMPLDGRKPGGIIIRVALPLKQISPVTSQIYQTVGITFLLALVIASVMGFWLVRRIIRPVREIVSAADAISKGDFNRQIAVASRDEIGALANSINLMNQELQKRFSAAMKYEELRKDFVANVSHELRTPLTFIKGYVETLREGGLDDKDKVQEFLAIIDKNVAQLTNLVEDLLELSRLESRIGVARIRPINSAKIMEEVIDNFQPAITHKKHTLIKNIPQTGLPEIAADPDLLMKALGNLLDNAIKYTPAQGRIEISAVSQPEAIAITVSDNGIGIPEEDLPRIFERFYRVDKSRSRKMGGTGLGLAIVKHIVQLHHGEISVRSEINKGSSFTILLPLNTPVV